MVDEAGYPLTYQRIKHHACTLHQVFKPYTKGTLHERNIDMLWAAQTLGLGLGSGLGSLFTICGDACPLLCVSALVT